jgi:hypothetical protein
MQCSGSEIAAFFLFFCRSCQQILTARPSCPVLFVLLSLTPSSCSQDFLKWSFIRNLSYQSLKLPLPQSIHTVKLFMSPMGQVLQNFNLGAFLLMSREEGGSGWHQNRETGGQP